ncbi:hypothetical protein DFP72DRAFT_767397, partial [Ephemerocybe angulata]
SIPFIEVHIDTPLSVVEDRDLKGLYKKSRAGEIKGMLVYAASIHPSSSSSHIDCAGISAPYEAPENPEIHIRTDETSVVEAVQKITEYL